jgi:hypothetical protein
VTSTMIRILDKPVFAVYYLTTYIDAEGRDVCKLMHYHTFYEIDRATAFMMNKAAENVVAMFPFENGTEPLEIIWEDKIWHHH